jgi:hypothetical protein
MAVTRTILPRKGLIQSQHGLTSYEADQDQNWELLDANVAFMADLENYALPAAQMTLNDYESSMIAWELILQSGIEYVLASPLGTGTAELLVI